MQQILFHIPVLKGIFGDEGLAVPGFGAMLFITFVVGMNFAIRRGSRVGISSERIQDMCLLLLITGIIGARIFYMVQYGIPLQQIHKIWEGGIVFYGSLLGGAIGFLIYYLKVIRPNQISTWALADVIAPTLALGLMFGRIGCLLNGCCYGQVACQECAGLQFPLLTAPVRSTMSPLQTLLGFTSGDRKDIDDPRTVVGAVEPDSQAMAAGLQPGDKITKVNGTVNGMVLELVGVTAEGLQNARAKLEQFGTIEEKIPFGSDKTHMFVHVAKPEFFLLAKDAASFITNAPLMSPVTDWLNSQLSNWPKGRSQVQFEVERHGQTVELSAYTPRSIPLQPTQLYESISMGLLTLLLICYYPFRRHDGQLMVIWLMCYAVHRYLNELLRNDTDPIVVYGSIKLSASMTIGIFIFIAAIALEIILRRTQPKREASLF